MIRYHKFVRVRGAPGGKNIRYGDHAIVAGNVGKAIRAKTQEARRAIRAEGVRIFLRDVYASLDVPQHVPKSDAWVVQCFFPEARYIGTMSVDPTMFAPVKEVQLLMAGKKMMQMRIPDDLHQWLRMFVLRKNTTATAVMTAYLQRLRAQDEGRVKVNEL